MDEPRIVLKIVIIGDGGAGKTSLMHRYCNHRFPEDYHPTIGVDFLTKQLTIRTTLVKAQFWDTAGNERFGHMRARFYRNASVAIVVCHLSSPQSIAHVASHCADFSQQTPGAPVVIVANKTDAALDGAEAEAAEVAATLGAPFCAASAKTSDGVTAAFEEAIALGLAHRDNEEWAALQKAQTKGFAKPGGVRLPYTAPHPSSTV